MSAARPSIVNAQWSELGVLLLLGKLTFCLRALVSLTQPSATRLQDCRCGVRPPQGLQWAASVDASRRKATENRDAVCYVLTCRRLVLVLERASHLSVSAAVYPYRIAESAAVFLMTHADVVNEVARLCAFDWSPTRAVSPP